MGFSFFDFLFPRRCAGCGRSGAYLCISCKNLQPRHFPQVCPVCERAAIDGRTHPGCRTSLSPDGATFIFRYKPPITELLKQLKYKFGRALKDVVVSWSVEELSVQSKHLSGSAVLVPIPLHSFRRNWRGFNQSEILGEVIAKRMGWEYRDNILIRSGFRRPQTEVKVAQRRQENVRGIFSINPSAQCLMPNNLVLFDDVWTTGATMKEAAKVLKRAGAKIVWALAIAR